MAIKVWNKSSFKLVVPGVSGPAFSLGEARIYDDIEYDSFINYDGVKPLLLKGLLKIKNLDNLDIQFNSEWNGAPHLTLGNYQYWVDSSGETRFVNGTPSSDLDGNVLSGSSPVVSSIYSDTVPASGRTFAQMRLSFFTWFKNSAMGTWDSLYKYCYWSFSYPGGTWSQLQTFATQDDLFTWLEANIPSSGSTYTANSISFRTLEYVDATDAFPYKVVHRNSLLASILGKNNYNVRKYAYGVSVEFNAPQYYTNYYGELAQRFVQADTGVLPIVNEDGAIWHTIRVRSKHGLPKIGSPIPINPNTRGAVWDTAAVSWVAPAPTGTYIVQTPFLLQEYRRRRVLQIITAPDASDWGRAATEAISALVFPVEYSGRWKAYAIYPYNYDSFSTENFDLGLYEIVLKLIYRNTSRPIYAVVPDPWYTVGTDDEHLMWSHWKVTSTVPLVLESILANKQPTSTGKNPDSNSYPDKVYLARRNKVTGMRSAWYPLYSIRRRTPYAAYRLLPARYPH